MATTNVPLSLIELGNIAWIFGSAATDTVPPAADPLEPAALDVAAPDVTAPAEDTPLDVAATEPVELPTAELTLEALPTALLLEEQPARVVAATATMDAKTLVLTLIMFLAFSEWSRWMG